MITKSDKQDDRSKINAKSDSTTLDKDGKKDAKGKNKARRPRLVTPSLMQAVTLPLYPYKTKKGEEKYGMFDHPDM